jgi:hypothetical protein
LHLSFALDAVAVAVADVVVVVVVVTGVGLLPEAEAAFPLALQIYSLILDLPQGQYLSPLTWLRSPSPSPAAEIASG